MLPSTRSAVRWRKARAWPRRSVATARPPSARRRRQGPGRLRRAAHIGHGRADATAAGRTRRRRHARDPDCTAAFRWLGAARTRRDQDLVQETFGPVDLDRSLVRLDPVDPPVADCAACRGERFGFPADLDDARALMCSPHRAAALAVTAQRITRARESNPVGWRAIGKASARIHGLPEPGGSPLPPRTGRSPARNSPCPCGSGRKYKHCCGA